MGNYGRLLVDTGAGINIIKRSCVVPSKIKTETAKSFFMGRDKHTTDETVELISFNKPHIFHVVPDDFPLLEDGIIGLPFLRKYEYEINNQILALDNFAISLYEEPGKAVAPDTYTIRTGFINDQATRICYINTGKKEISTKDQIECESDPSEIQNLLSKLRTQHIDPEHKDSIEKILASYHDIFSLDPDTLPCTKLTEHTITLKTDKPINVKSYRHPECHKSEIHRQIEEMLKKNVIENSDSPFNAPVWVVPKKLDASGKRKWRIVIDFRKLNEQTDLDAYPLPNTDEIMEHLGNAKFFSALDLSSGFHQIPMNPTSKKYTAFSTPDGHFHFNRMPFGLKNAPSTFQRMMDTALRGLIGKHCFVYLDDIIIFGSTIQEHNRNLAIVFQRLREVELKLQPDKCEFLKPELEYLGHLVTAEGIKPNPQKIEAIKNFKNPKTVTDIKSFLGLTGYYRKFIRNFSKIAKPLIGLTKKETPFHWTNEQQTAFDNLKDKLCNAPVLQYPDFTRQFTLTTDASNEGLGAILSQDGHYISRTLNTAEKNYSTTEKELLAIVWAIKRLRQYLLGRKFIIQTDHQALKWLKDVKDPSSRLMRWRLRLEEYDYDIEYRKGKENQAADALSRLYPLTDEITEQVMADTTNDPTSPSPGTSSDNNEQLYSDYENWKYNPTPSPIKHRANNPKWTQINKKTLGEFDERKWLRELNKLVRLETSKSNNQNLKFGINDPMITQLETIHIQLMLRFLTSTIPNATLTFANKPPREYTQDERNQILIENHNADSTQHLGENRTLARIQENHYWTGLEKDVHEFISQCRTCQQEKLTRIRPREEAVLTDTPLEPNDKISLDIFGPLPKTKSKNQYILSIQDQLTKYLLLIPLKDQQATTIIPALLNHYIYIFSSPKHILTDQGTNFVCKLMESFEQAFKIKHIKTTSFHPQSNGALERTHATVKDLIRTCTSDRQNEWDENLNLICMGYNTSVHEAIGTTPFELTFGHKANMPSTIAATPSMTKEELFRIWKNRHDEYLRKARQTLDRNKARYKRDQDRKIIRTQSIFNIGDKVLVHNDHKSNKLDREWLGPVTVTETSPPTYTIEYDNGRTQRIHGNRLKTFVPGRL